MECIYCNTDKVIKYGKINNKQRYKCDACGKLFNTDTKKKEDERKEKYESIKKMYLTENLSTIEIANKLGVSSTVIQRIIKKMGISKTISEAKSGKKIGSKLPKDKIVDLYINGKSCIEIASILNISKTSVLNILEENDVQRDNKYQYLHDEINKIEELYLSGLPMNKISSMLGIPYGTINYSLHKIGIVRTEDKYHIGMDYKEYLNNLSKYEKYRSDVMKITYQQKISELPNYNKRGISGIDNAYHLDHKFSILEGFKQGIEPEIIGNIENLEFYRGKKI